MNQIEDFEKEVEKNIASLAQSNEIHALSNEWMAQTAPHKYSYNFSWLGRPAIQFPTDAWAMQELIWRVKPDLIIETGIAHGGSILYYSSLMAQLDLCEAIASGGPLNPRETKRKVLGIDIDIRPHNRVAIESHPMSLYLEMIQGSSVSQDVITKVKDIAAGFSNIMVIFDSNHTHDHVLAELEAYAALTSVGSYCVVFDTIVEDMPCDMFLDRPWGVGDNPKTAVREFLRSHKQFEIDKNIQHKLLLTVAPDGYLKRIS